MSNSTKKWVIVEVATGRQRGTPFTSKEEAEEACKQTLTETKGATTLAVKEHLAE